MDKKELEAKKRELLRDLEKEKSKKRNAEDRLSSYEYKERQSAKKSKRSLIPENQKHTIVPVEYFENEYNYDERRRDWHRKAGHNESQLVCSRCKDDDNWETVLLDNGNHICYYCWIKKPSGLVRKSSTKKTSAKPKSAVKTTSTKKKSTKKSTTKKSSSSKSTKVKSTKVSAKKTSTKKTSRVHIPENQKHTIVPVEYFENEYNYDERRRDWHKKAGHNESQLVCSKCNDDDNWETILLDNGKHICYYCWIKKPSGLVRKSSTKKTSAKPKSAVKTTSTKKKSTKVKSTKVKSTKVSAKKTSTKKTSRVHIPENQKHTIVPVEYFENEYNYNERRTDWHKKAGHNDSQLVCSKCNDDDNWETILLDNGKHICYYCWIKKPDSLAKKSKKSTSKSTTKKVKTTSKVKSTSNKTKKVSNIDKDAKIVSVNVYEDYDFDKRLDQWNDYNTVVADGATCSFCKSKDNEEIILLDNNKKVCYYCWMDEPTDNKKTREIAETRELEAANESKGPGKWFWIITIITGLLLIALIVVLSLGIISDFTFKF